MRASPIRVRASGLSPTRARNRGFTLVELMTVVVITGVLATVGFAAVRGHVAAARGAEGIAVVQSIRAAQERWRSEHMMYLDVSQSDTWYPRDPLASTPNTQQAFFYAPGDTTHSDNARWILLRPSVTGAVRFGYRVNAGSAGATMTPAAIGPAITWPTPADNWYVIQAVGDADWDGEPSIYRASSLTGEVASIDHGE